MIEEQNTEALKKARIFSDNKDKIDGFYNGYVQATIDLEKENAELKCECRRCIHTDCPGILSDYGKDRNGICDHFKDVFDENVELKDIVRNTKAVDESFAKLQQENVKLKSRDCWKDCLYASGKSELIHEFLQQKYNLTKAKELLRDMIDTPVFNQMGGELYENEGYTELIEEAGQFLKENEQ